MFFSSRLIGKGDSQFLATFGNGRLYKWFAIETGRIAPDGWHISTDAELQTMRTFLGGEAVMGGKVKSTRTGLTPGWNAPNLGATNESFFTALGAGYRIAAGFTGLNDLMILGTATQLNATLAFGWVLTTDSALWIRSAYVKINGLSYRAVMDNPATWNEGDTVTDIDGNVYPTVKIGNQVWMASNLKTTRLNDGTAIPEVTATAEWAALTTPGQCTYNNAAIQEYQELWPPAA